MLLQAILLQAIKDNAAGQSQFQLLFYVAAPLDANLRGNTQLLHVVDQRTLPGEDAAFPWVRSCGCTPVNYCDTNKQDLCKAMREKQQSPVLQRTCNCGTYCHESLYGNSLELPQWQGSGMPCRCYSSCHLLEQAQQRAMPRISRPLGAPALYKAQLRQ